MTKGTESPDGVYTPLWILSLSSQVTETRTGPLGCSNYDNLDTVSSVLVHSPENKVHLQGKMCLSHHSGGISLCICALALLFSSQQALSK